MTDAVSDGGFTAAGEFVPLRRITDRQRHQLEELVRRRVLHWLVRIGKLPTPVAKSMLAWQHSGFSLHVKTRVRAHRREGLLCLATYMRRHPFSPKGIHENKAAGTVLYKASRMHGGKKKNFEVFDALGFLAALSDHIPHRRKYEVRYLGAAHPRVRKRLFGSQPAGRAAVPMPSRRSRTRKADEVGRG